MKLAYKSTGLEVRATDDEAGTIEGYGSVFGVEDSYGDVVVKGAFAETLASSRVVRMLWQHRSDMPIGKWTEMIEDERGLRAKGVINLKTTWGRDAYEAVKGGDVSGLSIGFRTLERQWNDEEGIRYLKKLELWELSVVTFPANEEAGIDGAKGFESLADIDGMDVVAIERSLRAGGFSREEAKRLLKRHEHLVVERRQSDTAAAELAAFIKTLRGK